MAAHKKLPLEGAAEEIERLASQGFGQIGIAYHLQVSVQTFKRWIEEDEYFIALSAALSTLLAVATIGKSTVQILQRVVVRTRMLRRSLVEKWGRMLHNTMRDTLFYSRHVGHRYQIIAPVTAVGVFFASVLVKYANEKHLKRTSCFVGVIERSKPDGNIRRFVIGRASVKIRPGDSHAQFARVAQKFRIEMRSTMVSVFMCDVHSTNQIARMLGCGCLIPWVRISES